MPASSAPPDVYAAWRAAPAQVVAEVIAGQLHTQARPALRHAFACSMLQQRLGSGFDGGHGSSGGWIDPDARTLEVFRLGADGYTLIATHAGDAHTRAEPFDALALDLALLWAA
jgi:hypothetical protein